MKRLEDEFGKNAGKVWQVINNHGTLGEIELRKTTKLDEKRLNTAIGWLARENKICKHNNLYYIGETNLTDKIGVNAGKVWNTLNEWGEIDISTIVKFSHIEERDAYYALGWLAREDKIQANIPKTKNSKIKFKLK